MQVSLHNPYFRKAILGIILLSLGGSLYLLEGEIANYFTCSGPSGCTGVTIALDFLILFVALFLSIFGLYTVVESSVKSFRLK